MEGFELIQQGAEARIYVGNYLGRRSIAKERFKKKYRHVDLDSRLTKDRMRAEARAIVRAKSAGVATPALYLVDSSRRTIYMEYIENARTLKSFVDERVASSGGSAEDLDACVERLAKALAEVVAKLHAKNTIHGDLTTSNVLIRHSDTGEVNNDSPELILIDFGLARVESMSEDKAVDLYVLERSLMSSHPEVPALFPHFLEKYVSLVPEKKQRREIVSKYEEVRARGRKRLAIG